jgi:Concanavalin A-like lectin/glucanases superfamily
MHASDRVKRTRKIIGLAAGIIGSSLVAQAWADTLVYDLPLNNSLSQTGTSANSASAITSTNNTTGSFISASPAPSPVSSYAYAVNGEPGVVGSGEQEGEGISLPNSSALNLGTNTTLTYVSWLNPANTNAFQDLISQGNTNYTQGWELYTNGSGKLQFNAGGSNAGSSSTALTQGQWNQVAVVIHANSASTNSMLGYYGNVSYYINGASASASNPISWFAGSNPDATSPISLASGSGNYMTWDGSMSDVGLFSTGLTSTQIEAAYNLAMYSGLNYTIGQADELYNLEQAGSGTATIGSMTWEYDPSVGGGGVVNNLGGGNYSVQLGATDGVETVAVPEPVSLGLLVVAGMGMQLRRRRRT